MHNQYITPAEKMQEPERLHDLRPNGTERPWAKWKREAQGLADIYEVLGCDPDNPQAAHDLDKARRVSECANYTEFQRHDPDGQHSGPWLTLHTANFCRNRLCPMCGWRRSLKLGSQAREVVAEANRQKVSRDGVAYKWLLVTFTVRNVTGPELGRTIDQLHKAAHNMAKTKRWKAAVKGWLRATEVTHNTDVKSASFDTFHPHLHFLLCVNSRYFKSADYIPQKEWKAMWERAASLNYDSQVNVKAVKDLENDPTKESKTSLGGALAEVTKYVCKPQGVVTWENPEMAVRTVLVLDRMLDGRRLTSWGGVLKEAAAKLKLDSIEAGDLVHVESESEDKDANAIADYVAFNWSVGVSDYLKFYDRQSKAPEVEKAIKADTAHKVNAKRAKSAAEGGRAKVRNDIIRRATKEDSDEWKEIHLGEIDLQDIFGG